MGVLRFFSETSFCSRGPRKMRSKKIFVFKADEGETTMRKVHED
jgi:hypothetical protein